MLSQFKIKQYFSTIIKAITNLINSNQNESINID